MSNINKHLGSDYVELTETEKMNAFRLRLASLVRSRRGKLELSQRELSLKVGMTRSSISNIERSMQNPTGHNFVKLLMFLDIELEELL